MTSLTKQQIRDDYRRLLREFKDNRSSAPIANRYPWQSKMAMAELLSFAASLRAVDVRLITGTGEDYIYRGEVAGQFRAAAEVGCAIKILICLKPLAGSASVLKNLARDLPDNVELKTLPQGPSWEDLPHFLSVDEQAYRLETPHRPFKDREFSDISPETVAQIRFKEDPSETRIVPLLNRVFDNAWSRAVAGHME